MTCEGDSSSTVQRWPHASVAKELRMQLAADKVTRAPSDYSSFSKHLLALGDPRTCPSIWMHLMTYAESFHCRSQWSLSPLCACKVNCPWPRQIFLCTHSCLFRNPSAARWFLFPDTGVRRKTSPCQFVLLSICSPDKSELVRVKSWAILDFGEVSQFKRLDRCWKTTWLEDEVAIWTLVKLQISSP